jgi:hypothetical protein
LLLVIPTDCRWPKHYHQVELSIFCAMNRKCSNARSVA